MTSLASGDSSGAGVTGKTPSDLVAENVKPKYNDELLPFDITITFANEYGNKASIVLYGVEILNEGTGFSIDAPSSEKAFTFICRSIDTMRPINDEYKGFISTTW